MNHVDKKAGFTLIELLFAMAFVSALLIAIVMTVIQISNIYNRGITLKEVDQAGRSLASELKRSIAQTFSFEVDPNMIGTRYIQQDWGGRLCAGQYSYVWNYGKDVAKKNTNRNRYDSVVFPNAPEIQFIKIPDGTGSYCDTDANGGLVKIPVAVQGTELLDIGDRNLAIHKFYISAVSSDNKTGQTLYGISFLLGTNNQLAQDITNDNCLPPSDLNSDLNYCSINDFNILVRSGNRVQ